MFERYSKDAIEKYISERSEKHLLYEILHELVEIKKCVCKQQPQPNGVRFVVANCLIDERENNIMADLVLGQGQSAPLELHYVFTDPATGNVTDLGVVPAADAAVVSASDASLGLAPNAANSAQVVASNTNTAAADDTVTVTGSAKGFTTTITVTASGTGTGGGGQTPNGVKFLIGTPTGGSTPAASASVRR